MKTLDDLLDAAAVDLYRAVAHVQTPVARGLDTNDVSVRNRQPGRGSNYGSRRLLVVGIAIAAFVVGGLLMIQRRPATQPGDSPERSISTVASTPTTPVFDTTHPPLELASTPARYSLVVQSVLPFERSQDLRSAIFVHRDAEGTIDGKVLARFGSFQIIGPTDGSLLPPQEGFYQQAVIPPTNLAAATSGNVYIELDNRLVLVQYPLGDLGSLTLTSYHVDAATDLSLAQEMQQIAATLQLTPAAITVHGPLPDRWDLAVAGAEPVTVTETYIQDFMSGISAIHISNIATNDVAMPYWQMNETLQPLDIRGHAGYVSTHRYPPLYANASPPSNPATATILIWPETAGHWVIVRADDMNIEQTLALAEDLTPASYGQWQLSGTSVATTTLFPTRTT
jgi:hypothetical protein